MAFPLSVMFGQSRTARPRQSACATGLALSLAVSVGAARAPARADIVPTSGPRSLGTSVSCSGGACGVDGGFSAGGRNLYHRFEAFDTRSGIERVNFRNGGHSGVIVGVLGKEGTFITAPVGLENPATLMWMSPGGFSISGNGSFQNVTQLGITTQTGLRMGGSWFDVVGTTRQDLAANADYATDIGLLERARLSTDTTSLAALGLAGAPGSIALSPAPGVELSVATNLLIDAGLGNLSSTGASLRAGDAASPRGTTSVALYGNTVVLGGTAIEAAADGIVNLQAAADLGMAAGSVEALKIALRGERVSLTGSTLTAPRGLIQLAAERAIEVSASSLDVAPRTPADLAGPGLGFTLEGTGVVSSEPAVISLATSAPGSLIRLRDVRLDASSLVAGIPGAESSPQDLVAGNVFVSSAGSLQLENATISADADRNYAGQISLLALDPNGPLDLIGSSLSATAPNGSGDISLYGAGPVTIAADSLLEASTTGLDVLQSSGRFNPSGEVRVTSTSAQGIRIEDSGLTSRYEITADPAPVFSFYQDPLDSQDNLPVFEPLGGLLRLTSAGPVEIRGSRLDSGSDSGVGGRVEIFSFGGDGVTLSDSSVLASVGGPLPEAIGEFLGRPPEAVEGLQDGRIDVWSAGGISLDASSSGGTVLDASNRNVSVRFDPASSGFVPLVGEINLIAAGQGDAGIRLRNAQLEVSAPVGSGFAVESQGGTVRLAVAGGSGAILEQNVNYRLAGDTPGAVERQLPPNDAAASYVNTTGQTAAEILQAELGSATALPRSLEQLRRFEASLLNDQVEIVVDARDASNVVVTVINQSLAATSQASTATAGSFDTTREEGRAALAALLTELGRSDLASGEALLAERAVEQAVGEALAADPVLAPAAVPTQPQGEGEAVLEGSLSAEGAAGSGSGAEDTGEEDATAGGQDAGAAQVATALRAAATRLPAAAATTALLEGEASSAAAVAAFLNQETKGTVPSVAQLQRHLRAGGRGAPTAVIRLSYGEAPGAGEGTGEGALDVVLVLPEGAPMGWRSRIGLAELRTLLRSYYTALAEQRSGLGEAGSPERALFDLILRPVLPSLEEAGVGGLILSADPSLIDIPFNALHDGEAYLGERFALAVTPSLAFTNLEQTATGGLSGDGEGRRMQAGASSFVNGLTPLPMVEQELQRLAEQQAGRATTLLNRAFTPVRFAEAFADPGTRQVHIASHAEIAAGEERVPRIYTSEEVIGLRELGRLRQRSSADALDLVTLSACRSALNAADLELGFAGLAVQMGARSAIGTKWYVDDTAMSTFFVMFYDQLRRGSSKAEALRATQRAFARGEVKVEGSRVVGPDGATLLADLPESYQHRYARGFSHPYYWAGVQLVGSPW